MSLRLPDASRNAMCNALVDLLDAGSGAGTIEVYTGSRPATPSSSPSGTLLVTFTCADPAFGASAAGVATIDADPDLSAVAVATGTAGWYRALDSDDAVIWDGTVTATGGGGDLELSSVSIVTDGVVLISAGTVTVPSS